MGKMMLCRGVVEGWCTGGCMHSKLHHRDPACNSAACPEMIGKGATCKELDEKDVAAWELVIKLT